MGNEDLEKNEHEEVEGKESIESGEDLQEEYGVDEPEISDEEYFKILFDIDPSLVEYKVNSSDVYTTTFLSLDHLRAAKLFVDNSKEIYSSRKDIKSPKEKFEAITKYRSYVINTITSSVAYMEATINEIYMLAFNTDEFNETYGTSTDEQTLKQITDEIRIKDDTLYIKVKKITDAFGVRHMWWKDIGILIELRNHLIHYHPIIDLHTGGENVSPTKIEELCEGLFEFEDTLIEEKDSAPFFPDKLGFDCANWALTNSSRYIRKLFVRLGLMELGSR
ncbi:hypothetical protein J2Y03_004626 [Neobacillus niacini]|uniref:hypothetical protein n=1 Tax=Neobacillus niacini TaxID=86668 RepID=UPI0028548768|nr:hypothetical protein [Neobacillus niacini]MDR7079568.1 hypothetical protein [Neobacillus niacini]